jgi:phosphotriesterase-related protein
MDRCSDVCPDTVETVTGPVPLDELGVTLTHEHVICDVTAWRNPIADPAIVDRRVDATLVARLRHNPFGSDDNLLLRDEELAVRELELFRASGGETARPAYVEAMSVEQLEEAIVRDVTVGVDGTDIRSGFVGEIGITDGSTEVTAYDERVLRGAARAHTRTGRATDDPLVRPARRSGARHRGGGGRPPAGHAALPHGAHASGPGVSATPSRRRP